MQTRRTRHRIQASPYGTQHNGHTYGFRIVQRIQDQDTAYRLHTQHSIHHILAYTRVICLEDTLFMAYTCCATCSNGQYCRTVAWVSCVCMCLLYVLCLYVQPRAPSMPALLSPSLAAPLLPCFHPPFPPRLHSLRLTDADMRL